jgi:hypothetical protein
MVSSGLLRRVDILRTTRLNNPEDTILHSHRRENLKSYIILRCLTNSSSIELECIYSVSRKKFCLSTF